MSSLYIGIDLGKRTHVAALISIELLTKFKKYEACPVQQVEQSHTGFVALAKLLNKYAELKDCHVLVEDTGHYGQALIQFLQANGVRVYRMHAKRRYAANKTDKGDAQSLAVLLYNQVELKTPIVNESERIHQLVAASPAARMLRGLVQHRIELQRECTQRKNKLISIADELFPELTTIYTNPNSESALNLRAAYPTPALIATASLDDLCATRKKGLPTPQAIKQLQEIAASSIGTTDECRQIGLLLEQDQLIKELRLLHSHIDQLDTKIEAIVAESREGQILASFPGVGPVQAATLLAGIGSIANFEDIAALRGYLGWAPRRSQTGTTYDNVTLNKGGNGLMKQTIYMVAIASIRHEGAWKTLYTRLVKQKCAYDARTQKHKGKMKVVGRLAGQIIGVMYVLLKRDHLMISGWPEDQPMPKPELYCVASHHVKAGER